MQGVHLEDIDKLLSEGDWSGRRSFELIYCAPHNVIVED
jgi:hypothetical protein